ncbi:MAG: long-chain-fatty-acid--CoA ligase [Bryobacterales bacterium]|nr:long-chain-fatty-acid--CoA ligase [Bryobacterales bacterium]
MFVPLTPLRCLHRAVDLFGHKTGVVSGDRRFTFAEFGARCERLATALAMEGIQPGDRVAYLSFNTHQLLEGYYGVIQAGAIVMPLNVRLTTHELAGILNHAGARMLIFEDDFAPLAEELRPLCPSIERYVATGEAPADLPYEALIAQGHPERADIFQVDENAIAELFYTSGSTGTPKGVALSHRTLYLHALGSGQVFAGDEHGVDLHTIPLFHANGWGKPQSSVMMGLRQVMVRRFEPTTVFRLVQEERATTMALVPTMANALINAPDLKEWDLSSLKVIHIGGAASSPELVERMETALGCQVWAGYGLTETSPVATSARPKSTIGELEGPERYRRQAMTGWPVCGVELRVVDIDMRDVPRDLASIGEIVIRGDHVMDGYYKEPEATRAVITDGWLHTGDMAVWDEESYVLIVDRKKDIIISGGENISSLEVEKAVGAHPAVFECAVVSAPDAKWGEIPVAIVVLKEGQTLDAEGLREFLAGRLAKYKMPRAIEFVEGPLPKTGTGKIMKRVLREPFWAGKDIRVQG